jgi:SAM-dependent methyltransferase
MSSAPDLDPAVIPLIRGSRILDVACGLGKWGKLIRSSWGFTWSGKLRVECEIIVGLDAYLPYLKSLRRQGIYDEVILANATALPFKEHSFDTVLAAEVIEHLSIKEGLKLIDECERISKEVVIITTPRRFSPQKGEENPFQTHRSVWKPSDFRRLGFKVFGVRTYPPFSQNKFLNALLYPFSWFIPELSSYLIAIKVK